MKLGFFSYSCLGFPSKKRLLLFTMQSSIEEDEELKRIATKFKIKSPFKLPFKVSQIVCSSGCLRPFPYWQNKFPQKYPNSEVTSRRRR